MAATDFEYTPGGWANNFPKLGPAIDYLKSLDLSQLLNDHKAFEAIFLWSKTHGYNTNDMSKYIETGKNAEIIGSLIGNILDEVSQHLNEIDFNDIYIELNDQKKVLPRNHLIMSLLTYLLYTVNLSLSASVVFNLNFTASNGLKACLRFLNPNDGILEKTLDATLKDFSLTNLNIVKYVLLDINAMSRNYEENATKWNELDALNILLNVAKMKSDAQFDAYVAISNIANDKQIESLNEVYTIVDLLVDMLKRGAADLNFGNFTRSSRQIIDQNRKPVYVEFLIVIRKDGIKSSIQTPLMALYRLAVNDALRSSIYFGSNIKNDIKVIYFASFNSI